MNGIRSVALIVLGLLIGFTVNHYGGEMAAMIFLPLFLLWLTLWDDKKSRQSQRREQYHYPNPTNHSYR